jgi:uncharacterized tellurite resistance protein B-like protein
MKLSRKQRNRIAKKNHLLRMQKSTKKECCIVPSNEECKKDGVEFNKAIADTNDEPTDISVIDIDGILKENEVRENTSNLEIDIHNANNAKSQTCIVELNLKAEGLSENVDKSRPMVEDEFTELKTSWRHAPIGAKFPQSKEIMIQICSFLNKNGGRIYIGVDDNGNVKGIKSDLNYIETYDHYLRDIQDTSVKYFPREHRNISVKMQGLKGENVVCIEVTPLSSGIAEVDNIAYERWGVECRVMSEERCNERKNLLDSISRLSKDKREKVNLLRQAISKKVCVILKNYKSGHSCTVRDRYLEVYALSYDHTCVFAYDSESSNSNDKNKQFKIDRAGSVVVTEDPWKYEGEHTTMHKDIFGFAGSLSLRAFHILMRLKVKAYNLLVEEYPDAKKYLRKIDESQWELDTNVYHLFGIGRFCIGLLDDIEIIEGDSLKKYLSEYIERIYKNHTAQMENAFEDDLKSLFLSLYNMALCDGSIDSKELDMLYQIGSEKGFSKEEIQSFITTPNNILIKPDTCEDKIAYLYNLTRIAYADGQIVEEEKELIEKYVVRFGFPQQMAASIVNLLIKNIKDGTSWTEILQSLTSAQ